MTALSWRQRQPKVRARRRGATWIEEVPSPDHAWSYRTAIVLSGGGNQGAAQVGMLRALLDAGIRPDLLVGCSVGALNGAYVAIDPDPARIDGLEAIWRSITSTDVFDGNRRSVATHLLRRDAHIYEADGLRSLISRFVPLADLAETAVPLEVVTTDLANGTASWWRSGDPVTILSASACLPGLFPPVPLAGGLHVDGGVLCPVPAQRALDLDAETVWVLDVSASRSTPLPAKPSALDVLLASFSVARNAGQTAVRAGVGQRVITITAEAQPGANVRDFSRTSELIAAGEHSARSAIRAAGWDALGGGAEAAS